MNLHSKTPAASVAAAAPEALRATADCPQHAGDGGAPASPSNSNRRAADAATVPPGQPKLVGRGLGNQNATAAVSIGAPCESPPVGFHGEPRKGAAAAPNRPTQFGPPTTHAPDGAGGPLNPYDREIRHWRAVGKPHLADGLQLARAMINRAFNQLEPVWVPTDGQLAIYSLRAGAARHGLCTMKAAA